MNKISPGCEGCDLKNDVVMSFLKGSVRFCKREKEKKNEFEVDIRVERVFLAHHPSYGS
jgi:hypothetical protein